MNLKKFCSSSCKPNRNSGEVKKQLRTMKMDQDILSKNIAQITTALITFENFFIALFMKKLSWGRFEPLIICSNVCFNSERSIDPIFNGAFLV